MINIKEYKLILFINLFYYKKIKFSNYNTNF